jgi:glycosyltransferase involved in cell wall biosynthesis
MLTVNAAWNAWNFRKALVREHIAEGHTVTVLAPPDESVARLEEMGCRFMPLAMSPSGLNPAEGASLVMSFRRAFRQQRPDVVLGYTVKNNIFGAIAAKSLGIPFIPNVTGLGTAFLSGKALETLAGLLYRGAFRKLPTVFFQNQDDRDLFVQRRLVAPEQARILPGSGIDLDHFTPVDVPHPTDGVTFLMIARLLRDKGVVEFVEAARMIRATLPAVRFQLLGALGADNVSAIDPRTLNGWVDEGAVDYLGATQDVRPHIAAAHCVVLPSYREGAPRTLIEAAAMARPVIATDVPGCRTVVERDVSGFLCAPRSAGSLAAAMRRFLDIQHDARVAMGRAGRERVETHFDEAHVVSSYREAIAFAKTKV